MSKCLYTDPAGNTWVIPSDAAIAVGRFLADGPVGWRSSHSVDAPVRLERADAVRDWCESRGGAS